MVLVPKRGTGDSEILGGIAWGHRRAELDTIMDDDIDTESSLKLQETIIESSHVYQ